MLSGRKQRLASPNSYPLAMVTKVMKFLKDELSSLVLVYLLPVVCLLFVVVTLFNYSLGFLRVS